MASEHGWIFYIEQHDGRIRNFTVGVEDEEAAKLAIQTHDPSVNFLSFVFKMRADSRLIDMLQLAGGRVMEWRPAEPGQAMSLHPGAVNMGSDYDPLRRK